MRPIDATPWRRFEFVLSCTEPTSVPVGRVFNRAQVLEPTEVNAACNATIIIDRMMRNGRSGWRRKMLNRLMGRYNDNRSAP